MVTTTGSSSLFKGRGLDNCSYFGYIVRIPLTKGAFREALSESGAGCGARARMNAIRSRAALGHRSAGKRTGPHGACLTQGVVRRMGKTPGAPCLEETRFWG